MDLGKVLKVKISKISTDKVKIQSQIISMILTEVK